MADRVIIGDCGVTIVGKTTAVYMSCQYGMQAEALIFNATTYVKCSLQAGEGYIREIGAKMQAFDKKTLY